MEQPKNNFEQPKSLEEGEAIMESSCTACNWKSEKKFTVGDDERDMVCVDLEDSHENTGCKGTLTFKERNSENG